MARIGSLSRRDFVRVMSGATALSLPGLLAGCGFVATVTPVPSTPTPVTAAPTSATPPPTGAHAAATALPAAPIGALSPTSAAQPRRGGTLRIAFPGSAARLDPATSLVNEDINVTQAVYNNLVRVDPQLRPRPDLATSWQTSDDLKTWTFQLRQGIKFHHGKMFTSDDVVFSFNRLLDPKMASPARTVLAFVDGLEKRGDHTVLFHLKEANADLLSILGFNQGRILPSDRGDEQIAKEPSGTGPFKFKELVVGDHATLLRNDAYWEPGLPYLDEVRHVTMPEQVSRVAALTGGTIDMIWQLNLEAVPTLEADPNVAVVVVESGGYQPIVMRGDKPPFDNPKLRLAMKQVVDRDQMRQAVLHGRGANGVDHPIAPINPLWTDLGPRPRDIARAKLLLTEAGYPDGIDLTLYTTDGRPGLVEQAITYKEMAAAAGIRISVQKFPNNVYWDDYWMKKDLVMSNWNLASSADETLALAYHSEAKWNETYWKSARLDDLISRGRAESDAAKRKLVYAEAARHIQDDGPVVISFFRPGVSAMRRSVRGFQVHPATWIDVRATWLAG